MKSEAPLLPRSRSRASCEWRNFAMTRINSEALRQRQQAALHDKQAAIEAMSGHERMHV
jgi:hypothetical protein